jgi:hypothetical protein
MYRKVDYPARTTILIQKPCRKKQRDFSCKENRRKYYGRCDTGPHRRDFGRWADRLQPLVRLESLRVATPYHPVGPYDMGGVVAPCEVELNQWSQNSSLSVN